MHCWVTVSTSPSKTCCILEEIPGETSWHLRNNYISCCSFGPIEAYQDLLNQDPLKAKKEGRNYLNHKKMHR